MYFDPNLDSLWLYHCQSLQNNVWSIPSLTKTILKSTNYKKTAPSIDFQEYHFKQKLKLNLPFFLKIIYFRSFIEDNGAGGKESSPIPGCHQDEWHTFAKNAQLDNLWCCIPFRSTEIQLSITEITYLGN